MPFPSVCKGKESLDAASPDSKSTTSASTTSTAGKVGGTSLVWLGRHPSSGHSCAVGPGDYSMQARWQPAPQQHAL